jgi:hypothetical protein
VRKPSGIRAQVSNAKTAAAVLTVRIGAVNRKVMVSLRRTLFTVRLLVKLMLRGLAAAALWRQQVAGGRSAKAVSARGVDGQLRLQRPGCFACSFLQP